MNKAILVGTIGKDVKTQTAKNLTICQFSLATSDSVKNKDGKWENITEWHNIKCFGKLAEIAGKFSKGDQVELSGKITHPKYTNKEGKEITYYEVVADSVVRKKKAEGNNNHQAHPQSKEESYTEADFDPQANPGDLPF